MAAVEISEHLPFKEAIEFFANKVRLPSSGWTDIWQEQHSHAFVVAGATHDNLLKDFFNALKAAQEEGTTYEEFRKSFDQIAQRHGWSYSGSLGWRSRVIYQTNMSSSYSAGRWAQIQKVKEFRPYLMYQHNTVENPRPLHQSWDGIILPVDDSWWDTHFVPNGWGCKCTVQSLSKWEAEDAWKAKGQTGPDTTPPIEYEERVVGKKTLPRVVRVPKGIDPGFAYNPGKAWLSPYTPPFTPATPLQGHEELLQMRRKNFQPENPPALPIPRSISSDAIKPKNYNPMDGVDLFLASFGASRKKGSVFTDKTGIHLAITESLFKNEKGKWKWDVQKTKTDRMRYVELMILAITDPDEIWWRWEKDRSDKGNWRLRRRYLKSFEVGKSKEYVISSFEWSREGWTGSTVFLPNAETAVERINYFNNQRVGKLLYKK